MPETRDDPEESWTTVHNCSTIDTSPQLAWYKPKGGPFPTEPPGLSIEDDGTRVSGGASGARVSQLKEPLTGPSEGCSYRSSFLPSGDGDRGRQRKNRRRK
ncbi:hypothetical protein DPEC_G00300950 [Dallia pectoralis]|uniref:Uncharacterized protein n=1 Tax=Dallia pectoralis TaxID=75939 RepID=A0ACC2FGM6_DALPE|nr:hypothetical protein DPEC_G00300950 [Dallia pectoralis]